MATTISNNGVRFRHEPGSTDIEIYAEAPTVLPIKEVVEDLIGLLSDEQATEVLLRLPAPLTPLAKHNQRPVLA
jgi:hypothetical protein